MATTTIVEECKLEEPAQRQMAAPAATTIGECASEEAAQRRERRKQRALAFKTGSDDQVQDEDDKITYVAPKYADYVDKFRLCVALSIGAILALVSLMCDCPGMLFLTTFCAALVYETLEFKSKNIRFPKHGYVVNAILAAGLDESVVIHLGMLIDILWEVGIDMLLVMVGFLTSKLLLTIPGSLIVVS